MPNDGDLYVIIGATGHIGRKLTERLLEKKQKVRAVARDRKKLEALATLGAEIFPALKNISCFPRCWKIQIASSPAKIVNSETMRRARRHGCKFW